MELLQKTAKEIKNQIQDFLDTTPYAEQLQGLLSLSDKDLQDPHIIECFLQQQGLDSNLWTQYLGSIKVKALLNTNQYFQNLDPDRKQEFLTADFELISFFNQHGFLDKDIFKTSKLMKYINLSRLSKKDFLDKLLFFTNKKIITPSNIFSVPKDLFFFSPPLIEYLDKISFFDHNPFFDQEEYSSYVGSPLQQHLLLFCNNQDSTALRKYESLDTMLDYKLPDFSEKLLQLITFTQTLPIKHWEAFFKVIPHIISKENYKNLLEKLEEKISFASQSSMSFCLDSILKTNQSILFIEGDISDSSSGNTTKKIENLLNMDYKEFSDLILKITKFKDSPHSRSFKDILSGIFEYDNFLDLFIKLEQKLSLADQDIVILLLTSNLKKIGYFLNMETEEFICLTKKIEKLTSSINKDVLKSPLEYIFQQDNYLELLSNLQFTLSCISGSTFMDYFSFNNESFHNLWIHYKQKNRPYLEALEKLKQSKIPELQYALKSFFPFILASTKPLDAFYALDVVYSSQALPHLIKNFSLFRLLYDDKQLEEVIGNATNISPYLKTLLPQNRVSVLYQDFLNITIKSNEASLKNLITQIVEELPLLKNFENWIQELKQRKTRTSLNSRFSLEEQNQLFQLFKAIEVLPFLLNPEAISFSSLKQASFSHTQLDTYYHFLLKKLEVRAGSSLTDTCNQSLSKRGYPQIRDVLKTMDQEKKRAMLNNTQKLEQHLTLHSGDFLKGVKKSETILQILQTGILSREYIGASGADSDSTPFDSDFQELDLQNTDQALADVFKTSYPTSIGNYLLLIKNPDQLFLKEQSYEKIIHDNIHKGNRGIRTGIPNSEISALIMPEEVKSEELEAFTYHIAQNGFYLPIYDRDGNLLFSLEEYHKLRKHFSFSPRYQGYIYNTDQKIEKEQDPDLKNLMPHHEFETSSNEKLDSIPFTAKKIQTYLKELGIFVSLEQKKNNQIASLVNIGSTSRGTATALSSQDQDFVLILPPQYADKKEEMVAHLHEKMKTSKKAENEGPRENGAYQLRSEINQLGENGSSLPLDLLIMENIHGIKISSADAMQERLMHIKRTQGEKNYNAVLSNIRAAKSLLADQGIYKRTEGGLGGIGVENWILQNEGSLEKAMKSFINTAYQGEYTKDKDPLPFTTFQTKYPIWDTGYNWKNGTIDNYISKISEEVYKKLLKFCVSYLIQKSAK